MNARLVWEEEFEQKDLEQEELEQEAEFPSSQLFGEVELPEEWLEKDVFAPCEFFLCKLDLSVFGGENLPSRGFLYVFIDMPSTIRKARAVVRYYADEPDACTDFNEGFFDDDLDASYILPIEETPIDIAECCNARGISGKVKRNFEFVGGLTDDCSVVVNERKNELLTVISVAANFLPDDLDVARLTVVLNAEQAKKGDFTSAKLVF